MELSCTTLAELYLDYVISKVGMVFENFYLSANVVIEENGTLFAKCWSILLSLFSTVTIQKGLNYEMHCLRLLENL